MSQAHISALPSPPWNNISARSHIPPIAIPSLQLHHAPPIPHSTRAQRGIRHPDIFRCGICKRVAVARKIVRHAVRDDSQVFGEVQRRGDYEEGEEEKEYRVCRNC